MGGAIRADPAADALSGAPASSGRPGGSIGAFLARERRLRGIRLEEVERFTRIPRRSLERLEGGAFDGSADGFARGFVRTVAGAIGLDPDDAVARMLEEPDPRSVAASAGSGRHSPSPWLAGLVALALGAGMLAGGLALRGWAGAAGGAPEPERVRRDHVRSLAVSEGLVAPRRAPARDGAAEGAGRERAPVAREASPRRLADGEGL